MSDKTIIESRALNLYYGDNHALKDISIQIPANKITALIGPSGCGKSTFLKTLNRMNDLVEGVKIDGEVLYNGENIYGKDVDVTRDVYKRQDVSSAPGTKLAPMPWMAWGPACPSLSSGEAAGSTAMTSIPMVTGRRV